MSAGSSLPKYIPPPTVFLLNRSGVKYGTKPLPNKHWELVRTNVKNRRMQDRRGSRNDSNTNDRRRSLAQNQDTQKEQLKYANGGHRNSKNYGPKQQNEGLKRNEDQNNRPHYDDGEELQTMENEQFHYAEPNFDKIFDTADKASGSKEENQHSRYNGSEASVNQNENYEDDVDWQKKIERENGNNYDWSKKRQRNNSVYDPETTKMRAQKIDQNKNDSDEISSPLKNGVSNRDSRGRSRRKATIKNPELANKENAQEPVNNLNSDGEKESGTSDGNVSESKKEKEDEERNDSGGSEDKNRDENGGLNGEYMKNKLKEFNNTIKKCTPQFAEKLLDVLEKKKSDCLICFDDICKSYKKDNKEPLFSSYSCENGETTANTKGSMKAKLSDLVGGVYTKAYKGAEVIKDAAEDLLDEIKPSNDGSWSPIGGEDGVRCVPHYDNRIEDHTVYVCSCCFNEVIERDAHVNIKYFEAGFGCCKPKIVSRSFENRPYYCEKLLSSMSAKRRECFLKRFGKHHQLKGGVHCISVIPSMEQEFLEQQEELKRRNSKKDDTPEESSNEKGQNIE